ncbi:LysR family transcriptional regulator [Saccharopolyspora sp. WRP15-2]|uniref:LysR family transcriptional regulator n=1 Tax=Saccharopolyspora oryzae TaxID=2997343 RepID=A0ABT4V2Q5_9PSEU|nr:LysR family transcriptional regulator [Saccharopolyspora oryzae]MDA3628249.1 LysR family transcriptional regulator [Saccharopolyspora oryzae]
MTIEIRQLRMICAIAETGSITRAAARLELTQPALSNQLQAIEKMLGDPLFVRSRTGVVPTDFGRRTVDRARIVLSEVDSLFGAAGRPSPSTEPLHLGCAHLACVPSVVDRMQDGRLGQSVMLHVESSAAVLADSLSRGRYDAGLVANAEGFSLALERPVISRVLVPRYPWFVALAADHWAADRDEVRLADLADESWIGPPGADDGSLAVFRSACLDAGFEPRIQFEAPSGGARELVARGYGIRLVEPTFAVPEGTAVLPLAGHPLVARLAVAWRPDRLTRAQADVLYQDLARAYLAHVPDNPAFHRWWNAHPEVHPVL